MERFPKRMSTTKSIRLTLAEMEAAMELGHVAGHEDNFNKLVRAALAQYAKDYPNVHWPEEFRKAS